MTKHRWRDVPEDPNGRNVVDGAFRSIVFSTGELLVLGMHRTIVRYNCLSVGQSIGCIGILRRQGGDGGLPPDDVAWQASWMIPAPYRLEELVLGMEYDADRRTLRMYKRNSKTNAMEPTAADGSTTNVANKGIALCFAALLSSRSVGFRGNQLSVHLCKAGE